VFPCGVRELDVEFDLVPDLEPLSPEGRNVFEPAVLASKVRHRGAGRVHDEVGVIDLDRDRDVALSESRRRGRVAIAKQLERSAHEL
jgi:hypothetical protein